MRLTITANTIAIARNAEREPDHEDRRRAPRAAGPARTAAPSVGSPPGSAAVKLVVRKSRPAISTSSPCPSGQLHVRGRAATSTPAPSSPRSTRVPTSVSSRDLVRVGLRRRHRDRDLPDRLLARCPAAAPARPRSPAASPISNVPEPVHPQLDALRADLLARASSSRRCTAALSLVLDRRGQHDVALQRPRRGHRVRRASSWNRFCATVCASPSSELNFELSPASSRKKSATPDRDHRHDDDHREEEPQPAAEGGLEQGHWSGGAGRQSSRDARWTSRARRLQCALGRQDPDSCRSAWGYSSVGRVPGSHPGGRGFESP